MIGAWLLISEEKYKSYVFKTKCKNIIVAADIHKKRENIRKNIIAWLQSPIWVCNIFTAGDKHFFRYLENVKKKLN